ERGGATVACTAPTGSVPLHPYARLVGEPDRVLLQHPKQTRLGPQRTALQAGPERTAQSLHRQLQRNVQSVYLDQRARAPPTNHRDDQGISGTSSQKAAPSSRQAEEGRFYKGLTGRCARTLSEVPGQQSPTAPEVLEYGISGGNSAKSDNCRCQ